MLLYSQKREYSLLNGLAAIKDKKHLKYLLHLLLIHLQEELERGRWHLLAEHVRADMKTEIQIKKCSDQICSAADFDSIP